ncbi:Lupus La protein [Parasponia andersonii]|uniref:Lupus La protein n=1 Tax=Parasponia andersonii TaxID=3476 RepID=A0A2P5DH35_PARAD|nr:Lupus La protein [Parasponia andersonii]
MYPEEVPATATVVAASSSSSLSPLECTDILLVGSPDPAMDDAHEVLCKDEQDQDHDVNHGLVHGDEPFAVGVDGLSEDLKCKIIRQVEYYFSDENLPTDKHMISLIRKNKEGFVPIAVIASFRKMKKLIRDNALLAVALRESSFLVVSLDGKKVKRLHPFPFSEARDSKLYTVLVENLPEDHSVENIRKIFGEAGNIKHICICDPHATEVSLKGDRAEKFINIKVRNQKD